MKRALGTLLLVVSCAGSRPQAPAPRRPAHVEHAHPHLHPHATNGHHHHPHPHPHLEGQDGHHHPY